MLLTALGRAGSVVMVVMVVMEVEVGGGGWSAREGGRRA